MSGFGRALAAVLLLVVLGGFGIAIYNAGVTEGVAEAARAAQAAGEDPAIVYPPYVGGPYGYGHGYGWGGGFGFFGFLFAILGIFLIFGLIRAAFGWGRWNGGGGRGGGGQGGRSWGWREERMADYHRELHRRDDQPQQSTS